MGLDMAFRYRPMRVFPTMTTSVVKPVLLFAFGDIMGVGNNRQQAICDRTYREGWVFFSFVALRAP